MTFRMVAVLGAVAMMGSAPAADPITLTAEASEVVQLQADQAKIYVTVSSKDGTVEDASKANADLRKKFSEAVEKAGVKGLKATALQERLTKELTSNGGQFPGGGLRRPGGVIDPPPVESFTVAQPMLFTVTNPDPDKLVDGVEKFLRVVAATGVTAASGVDPRYGGGWGGPGGYNDSRSVGTVTYVSTVGWEKVTTEGLTKATAQALKNTEALARGAGLKVTQVLAVEDVSGEPLRGGGYGGGYSDSGGVMSDSRLLTRSVRVRVKVAAEK